MESPNPERNRSKARRKRVLFVLAHQDDECFLSTRIERESGRGHVVWCVYLTDGDVRGVDPRRREAESLRMLEKLGVPRDRVLFLGSAARIPDGRLHLHLDTALGALAKRFEGTSFHRIYLPAFEGGHQDHDAAHLVASAFARRRSLLGRTWSLPLYHGYRLPWRFFRVIRLLPGGNRRCVRRLAAGQAWRHALLFLRYPSQWRSWIGLAPGFLYARVVRRREAMQPVDLRRLRERPHQGRLLYERRRACDHESFRRSATAFLERHLS